MLYKQLAGDAALRCQMMSGNVLDNVVPWESTGISDPRPIISFQVEHICVTVISHLCIILWFHFVLFECFICLTILIN